MNNIPLKKPTGGTFEREGRLLEENSWNNSDLLSLTSDIILH